VTTSLTKAELLALSQTAKDIDPKSRRLERMAQRAEEKTGPFLNHISE